jgi:hypothetical protein
VRHVDIVVGRPNPIRGSIESDIPKSAADNGEQANLAWREPEESVRWSGPTTK